MRVPSSIPSRPASAEVPADILLRALAISFVAFNHAFTAQLDVRWFDGGMSVLMMLSGANFARFGMSDADAGQTVLALIRSAGKFVVPAGFIAVVVSFHMGAEAFTLDRLTYVFVALPLWYAQVIIAICLGLAALFYVPAFAKTFFRRPLFVSVAILAAALAVRAVCPMIWPPGTSEHHYPHLFLWNFILGWVMHFLMKKYGPGWRRFASGMAFALAGGAIGWGIATPACWYLAAAAAILLTTESVRLPATAGRIVNVTAQATFFIYLTHWVFVGAVKHALDIQTATQAAITPIFVVSLLALWIGLEVLSVFCWLIWTATGRAYKSERARLSAPAVQAAELAA